jgi:redox-sensing transcriptional repressor
MKRYSTDAIQRISMYLRELKRLKDKGTTLVSSVALAQAVNVTPDQLRKDLSYLGGFGKRGVGYNVGYLIEKLQEIFGLNNRWNIALVGVGRLGSALMSYPGFALEHVKITAAFDKDTAKVGTLCAGVKVDHIDDLKKVVDEQAIKVGMLCVQAEVAQDITDMLVAAGIKAILNFAPVNVSVPQGIFVSRVDMGSKLESLIFFLHSGDTQALPQNAEV